MKFISLMDTHNQNVITVDADSLVLRLEMDSIPREKRIKPFMASILYPLFDRHPTPLSYEKITEILKKHGLVISDVTRMHRKLSEIRQLIQEWHPSLENFILNTRGVGYSLPLRFKNLHQVRHPKNKTEFANPKMTQAVWVLEALINDAIDMVLSSKVIKGAGGYVMDRDPIKNLLVEKIAAFHECEKIISKEIRAHEADFISLRINYVLAKLKTYIGFARISEYAISQTQWLDWFTQEVWMVFEEIKKLIGASERV